MTNCIKGIQWNTQTMTEHYFSHEKLALKEWKATK